MDQVQPRDGDAAPFSTERKRQLQRDAEINGEQQERWRKFNSSYYDADRRYMQFLIPPGKRVLELGCGRGELLAALKPAYGVGVDFSRAQIAAANALHPDLHFVLGDAEDARTLASLEGPFDFIIIADTIGMFEDIDDTLRMIHQLCAPSTRLKRSNTCGSSAGGIPVPVSRTLISA